jgi:dolichol kinase
MGFDLTPYNIYDTSFFSDILFFNDFRLQRLSQIPLSHDLIGKTSSLLFIVCALGLVLIGVGDSLGAVIGIYLKEMKLKLEKNVNNLNSGKDTSKNKDPASYLKSKFPIKIVIYNFCHFWPNTNKYIEVSLIAVLCTFLSFLFLTLIFLNCCYFSSNHSSNNSDIDISYNFLTLPFSFSFLFFFFLMILWLFMEEAYTTVNDNIFLPLLSICVLSVLIILEN